MTPWTLLLAGLCSVAAFFIGEDIGYKRGARDGYSTEHANWQKELARHDAEEKFLRENMQ